MRGSIPPIMIMLDKFIAFMKAEGVRPAAMNTYTNHLDHSSLVIMQIYTGHYDQNLNQTIYCKAPEY